MNVQKISIPFSDDEMVQIKTQAQNECRRPADQIRYVVLKSLGLIEVGVCEDCEGIGQSLQTATDAPAATL